MSDPFLAALRKRPPDNRKTVCCDFCGRDTRNKSRICGRCAKSRHHLTYAPAVADCTIEFEGPLELEFSEDSLGPKQAEDRMLAIWLDTQSQWTDRRIDNDGSKKNWRLGVMTPETN